MNRIIADTGKARQHWERRSDPLPYLLVPMSDHTIVRYNPEIEKPRPFLREALDRFTRLCAGQKTKGEKEE